MLFSRRPSLSRIPNPLTISLLVVGLWASSSSKFALAQGTPEAPATTPETTLSPDDLQGRLDAVDKKLEALPVEQLDPISLLLPGVNSNIPSAYGATKDTIAVGIGYQNRTRYTNSRDDGAIGAVIGFGDPRKIGADLQVSALDLSRPGNRISFGFKLHHELGNEYVVAVGGENLYVTDYSDSDRSYYGVISKKFRLKESSRTPFSRLYASIGVGNGRFQSESDYLNDKDNLNVFGSLAINVRPDVTVYTEWTGQSLGIGTSFVPNRKIPLVITAGFADVAGAGGDGSRFTLGLGYVYQR